MSDGSATALPATARLRTAALEWPGSPRHLLGDLFSARFFRLVRHAAGALWDQKLKSLLMFLGTAIGIALLTAVVGLSQGIQQRVDEMTASWGPKGMMVWAGGGRSGGFHSRQASGTPLKQADLDAVRSTFGRRAVVSASARVGSTTLKAGDAEFQTRVEGVDQNWPQAWDWYVASGDPIDEEDLRTLARVCVLGTTVAKNLFGDEDPVGRTVNINKTRFRVKGILASRGTNSMGWDQDDRALVPVTTAMKRISKRDNYSGFRLKALDQDDVEPLAEDVRAFLRARRGITDPKDDDFSVRTPAFILERAAEMTRTVRLVGIALTVVALVVGGVVLMNILLLSISERTFEIGLKRSLGAREADIFLEFLAESVLVSLMGMVFGVLLGVVPVTLIPKAFPMMPMALSWTTFLWASLFSTVVGLVFGVQPARRAARLNPVEALR